jgi:hypothetical protein
MALRWWCKEAVDQEPDSHSNQMAFWDLRSVRSDGETGELTSVRRQARVTLPFLSFRSCSEIHPSRALSRSDPASTSNVPSRFIGSFVFDFFHLFVATAARRWIASQEA